MQLAKSKLMLSYASTTHATLRLLTLKTPRTQNANVDQKQS